MNTQPNPDKEIISPKMLEKILQLSDSEYKIFRLMGQGLTDYEIQQAHGGCSPKTTAAHKIHIRQKLHIKNTTRIIAIASRYNLFRAHHPEITREQIPAHNLYKETAVITNQTPLI